MIFTETKLTGAFLIDLEWRKDERGFFARTWCREEFASAGLETRFVQANHAGNHLQGTLRGMHFQRPPFEETKLVRCIRGALYDVIIDLRPNSPTRGQWFGVELTELDQRMLYVPRGFAHGYQTLTDHTEITYQVSEFYAPRHEGGVRYNDPAFGIEWPLEVTAISDKDRCHPLWDTAASKLRV
jgi:dTDP-4-dehydrorhamnose 3,5-epimerase